MKKNYLLFFALCAGFAANAQVINFPDPVFKAKLLEADVNNNIAKDVNNISIKIDANANGEIEQSEALLVYRLLYQAGPPIRPVFSDPVKSIEVDPITDVTGIAYFTNLRKLDLSDQQIETIDLSALAFLDYFNCNNSGVHTLNTSTLSALTYLDCSQNALTELNVSGNTALVTLVCSNNQIAQLSLIGLTNLGYLYASNNAMTAIDFAANSNLIIVYCDTNQLQQIDLTDTSAIVLHCFDNPNLTVIKVKNNVDSPFTYDVFPLPPLNAFEFGNLPLLETVCCDAAEVAVMEQVLAAQPGVTVATDCIPSIVYIPDANFKNKLLNTNCASFEEGVPPTSYTNRVDTNEDGEIQISEALAVKGLKVNTSIMTTAGDLESLEGLQYFTNLQRLVCYGNQIESLDVTMLQDLVELDCHHNHLATLDFSGLPVLDLVRCYHNSISVMPLDNLPMLRFLQASQNSLGQLDVTGLPALEALSCESNQLTALEIHDMPTLREVEAFNNLLTAIDLDGLTELRFLGIENNLFTSFNLSLLTGLEILNISSNAITEIDVDGHAGLNQLKIGNTLVSEIDCSLSGVRYLSCSFNPNLTSINLKNGAISTTDTDLLDYAFVFSELPLLTRICIDDDESERYSVSVTDYNATGNVTVYTGDDCLTEVVMATSEFKLSDTLRIYPNPVADLLYIDAAIGEQITDANIYNSLGQRVLITNGESEINVSGLASGIYSIKVGSDKGTSTLKFIKQ